MHADYQSLIDDPAIDAAYIPLPNSRHVDWTLRALRAGKNVLCEKPIAMRADEIDGLIDERDRSGLLVAEAFMIVHHPQWQHVRNLLASGAIGQLRHVEGVFCFPVDPDADNIRNRAELGGGALRDLGVYVIGSTRLATGLEPETISSRMRRSANIDTFTHLIGRFPGFTFSAIVSVWMAPAQRMTFYGTGGSIDVAAPFTANLYGSTTVALRRSGADEEVCRFDWVRQYERQVEAFNRSVLEGATYPCPLEFSRGTQAVVDRAFETQESLD